MPTGSENTKNMMKVSRPIVSLYSRPPAASANNV